MCGTSFELDVVSRVDVRAAAASAINVRVCKGGSVAGLPRRSGGPLDFTSYQLTAVRAHCATCMVHRWPLLAGSLLLQRAHFATAAPLPFPPAAGLSGRLHGRRHARCDAPGSPVKNYLPTSHGVTETEREERRLSTSTLLYALLGF